MEQQRMEQQRMEQQRMEQQRMEQQRMEQQRQQQMMMEQQRVEEERRLAVSLEEEKRREYEVWFKNQEKAAMEYSASVQLLLSQLSRVRICEVSMNICSVIIFTLSN